MEPRAVAMSDARWRVGMGLLALTVLCASVTPLLPAGRHDLRAVPASGHRVAPSPISSPSLTFVRNVGQSDPRIRFAATTAFGDAMFTERGAVLRLAGPAGEPGWVLRTAFVSGRPASPEGVHRSSTVVSYFGAGRGGWSGQPPAFDEVRYPRVWPGVDVTYSGPAGRIESAFVVHPGADPGDIRLRFLGQTTMAVNATMGVVLGTPLGSVVEPPPVAYQLKDGARVPVHARFRMVVGDADRPSACRSVRTTDPGRSSSIRQ